MRLFKYISIFLTILLVVLYVFNRPQSYQTYSGKIFGTFYHIKIKSPIENKILGKKIKHILKLTNYQMSVFEDNSELNKINKAAAGETLKLSPEMSRVLQEAAEIYELSDGSFDPTVGPLINLWGFGIKEGGNFPDDDTIKETIRHIGYKKLHFSDDYTQLQKNDPRLYLNLSAIAKGYAVDRVAEFLNAEGYRNYVVEIGGEVRASGERTTGRGGWNIGIRNPDNDGNALVLTLSGKSMATSGDYRNYFIKDGVRYAHTISPHSGYPLNDRLASVTVIDDSAMRADALATAIMAKGYPQGLEFADRKKIPAILFIRNNAADGGEEEFEMQLSKSAKKVLGEKF